jgi:hypothetical protein
MAQNDPNGNRQDQGSDRQNEKRSEDELTRQSRSGTDRQSGQSDSSTTNRDGISRDISDSDDLDDIDDLDEDRDDDLRTTGGSNRRGR